MVMLVSGLLKLAEVSNSVGTGAITSVLHLIFSFDLTRNSSKCLIFLNFSVDKSVVDLVEDSCIL